MEIRQLRHFLTVLERGSLSEAARELNLSQPAVSKSILALEQSLGVALFARSSHGMQPTAFGKCLVPRARLICGEVGRAEQEIGELLGVQRGRVAIGTGPSFSKEIVPKAVVSFVRSYPNVEVVVIEGLVDTLIPAIKAGEIEFALLTVGNRLSDPELEQQAFLVKDSGIVLSSARNPLASKKVVGPRQLVGEPWLLPKAPDQFRTKLEQTFARFKLPAPKPIIEFNSVQFAKAILREGPFVSFLPELLVREEIAAGHLKVIHARGFTWNREMGVVFRRGALLSAAAQRLLETIRKMSHRNPASP